MVSFSACSTVPLIVINHIRRGFNLYSQSFIISALVIFHWGGGAETYLICLRNSKHNPDVFSPFQLIWRIRALWLKTTVTQ